MRVHDILRVRASTVALVAALGMAGMPSMALAAGLVLPSGGSVVAGSANISGSATGITVDQTTATAVIDWQGFSVGAGGFAQFNNGTGATLNRVTGGDISTIAGQLSATGSLYLINPAGVVVDSSGSVLTGGSFVASTRIADVDAFLRGGELSFLGEGAGGVVNRGSISTGGDAVLIGRFAENRGSIDAKGSALLASGTRIVLREASADARIYVDGGTGDVTNSGDITAAAAELRSAGGNVYALAGNNGGLMRATASSLGGGKVVLASANDTVVEGRIEAIGEGGNGGTVYVLGKNIALRPGSEIDASGAGNGGTVLVGGDYLGGRDGRRFTDLALPTAATLDMASGAKIVANGGVGSGSGEGGNVVLWSDLDTNFQGDISVRGGAEGGDGGFIETSSKGFLNFDGAVDTRAPKGATGTLLLDPTDITISTGANSNSNQSGGNPNTFNSTSNTSVINTGTLQTALGSANVIIDSSGSGGGTGNITIANPILTWSSGNSLTLNAHANIVVNSGATLTKAGGNTATVTFNAGTGGTGNITFNTVAAYLSLADTASNVLNLTLNAPNGSITTTSGTSFVAGGTNPRLNLSMTAATGITLNGTGAITTLGGTVSATNTGTGSMSFGGAITTANGAVTLANNGTGTLTTTGAINAGTAAIALTTAAGNVTVNGALISTRGGATAINIVAGGSGNTLTTGAGGTITNGTGAGGISLNADQMAIGASVSIGASGVGGKISVAPVTAGRTITVGANDDTSKLQFDATEYARFLGGSGVGNASIVEFNTGAGGTFESKTATVTTATNLEVNIVADRVSLATLMTAGKGYNIAPATSGRAILLGGTDDASANLELSATEIGTNIQAAARVRIGAVATAVSGNTVSGIAAASGGALTITAGITKAGPLSLLSQGAISDVVSGVSTGSLVNITNLRVTSAATSGAGISLTNSANQFTGIVTLATSGADAAIHDTSGGFNMSAAGVDGQSGLNVGTGSALVRMAVVGATSPVLTGTFTADKLAFVIDNDIVSNARFEAFQIGTASSNNVGTLALWSNARPASANDTFTFEDVNGLDIGTVTVATGITGFDYNPFLGGSQTDISGLTLTATTGDRRANLYGQAGANFTQSAPITLANLILSGRDSAANGVNFTFTNASNDIDTLLERSIVSGALINTSIANWRNEGTNPRQLGSISFTDVDDISFGTVGSLIGPKMNGTLTLNAGGAITQTNPFMATSASLTTTNNALITLTNADNAVTTLAVSAGTGAVQYTDRDGFDVGTVGSVTGVSTTGPVTLTASAGIANGFTAAPMTQSQAIAATDFRAVNSGAAGTIVLTNTSNNVSNLSLGSAADASFTDSDGFQIGFGTVGINAGTNTVTLRSGGNVTQGGVLGNAIIGGGNLALLGIGMGTPNYTLGNVENLVGTLAANAGAISFVEKTGSALTVGTVGATTGITSSGNVTISSDQLAISQAITAGTASGSQIVTLTTTTTNRAIHLGAADSGSELGLTDTELDLVTAGVLRVTGNTTAPISVRTAGIGPDNVGTLTLTTGGSIDDNGDTGTISTGAGTLRLRINTTGSADLSGTNNVSHLQANVATGGLQFTDTNGFRIDAVDTGLAGTSGLNLTQNNQNIVLSTTGTIDQATGANITTAGTTGGLSLLGTGGTYTLNNSGNNVQLLAGNTGAVSYVDNNALTINLVAGTNGLTTNGAGGISLTAGAGGTNDFLTTTATMGQIASGTAGDIFLLADRMAISGTVSASTTTGRVVSLRTFTAGRAIDFGGSGADGDDSTTLKLDTSEMARITADITRIGDLQAGNLTVLSAFTNNSNVLSLKGGAGITQAGGAGITTNDLAIELGGTGTVNLLTANNSVNNVAIMATGGGNISFRDDNGFVVNTVDGISFSNVAPGTLTLQSNGAVTQGHALTAGNLALTGTGGSFTLTNASNAIGAVEGNAASISLRDSTGGLVIGGVSGSLSGIVTSGALSIEAAGAVTQTEAVSASTANFTGTGSSYALGNQSNTVNTLTANTGSIDFHNAQALSVGNVTATSTAAGTTAKISAVGGNLTLTGTVSTTGGVSGDDRVVLFTNRDILANAGSDITTGSGRFLAYTNNPNRSVTGTGTTGRDDSAGDWAGTAINASASSAIRTAGHVYNNATSLTTANRNGVAVTPAGNRFVYADQPTLIYNIEATTTKVYNRATTTPAVTYTSGLINTAGATVGQIGNSVTDTLTPNNVTGTAATSQTPTNAGTYTGITASQGSLASALGYAFAFDGTNTTTITPKPLTITGATAQNKVYDANTTATVTGASIASGIEAGDTVTLSALNATFASKNVANGIAVTVTGATLGGADAANYTVANPMGLTANITLRPITLTAANDTKVYDSFNTSALTSSTVTGGSLAAGETYGGATQTFDGANVVGTSATNITAGTESFGGAGALASNYDITRVAGTGSITARPLTVNGITAANKEYDGLTATTFTGTPGFAAPGAGTGLVGTQSFTITNGTVAFATAGAANGKTVNATGFGVTTPVNGAIATNYAIQQPTGLTANVTPRAITITAATSTKTYDGNTTSAGTPTITSGSLVAGETLNALSQTFNTAAASAVAGDKTLTVAAPTFNAGSAANYTITLATNIGTINRKDLQVTGITADNKVYNANTTATLSGTPTVTTGVGGETFTINAGTGIFASKNVANGIGVTASGFTFGTAGGGADANNYNILQPTGLTANITPRPITLTAANDTKVYDSFNTSALTSSTVTGGSLAPGETYGGATQTFNGANVVGTSATNITAGTESFGGAGALASNYDITRVAGTGSITARPLTVNGITAANKEYDGLTATTFTGTPGFAAPGVGTGLVGTQSFTITNGTVAFATAGAANGKTVNATGFGVTTPVNGAVATNYAIQQPTGLTANVTPRAITITAATSTKTYDGNTTSAGTPTITSGSLVAGETLNALSQTFNTAAASAVPGDKTLTVAAPTFSAGSAANYTITLQTNTGTINRKAIQITGVTADNKIYNNSTTATLSGTPTITGLVGGESFAVDASGVTAAFADKNVANGIGVTASGYALGAGSGGGFASNYMLSQPTGLAANITVRTLTLTADNKNKTFDNNPATDPALTFSVGASTATTNLAPGETIGAVTTGAITRVAGQTVENSPYAITQGTLAAANGNYQIAFNNGTFTINPAGISLTYIVGDSTYVYGDTPVFGSAAFSANTKATLTGVIGGDNVQVNIGNLSVFQNDGTTFVAAAGTATGTTLNASGTAYKVKPVSLTLGGTNANNYVITDVGSTPGNLLVTPRPLTATLQNPVVSKTYDGNTTATLAAANYNIAGFVGGQGATVTETVGAYDTANAGTGKGVTATLAGNDFTANFGTTLANYTLPTTATGNIGTILKKDLQVTGAAAQNRIYDATTNAVVTGGTVTTGIGAETFSVNAGTGTFASKNVANGIGVTASGFTVTSTGGGANVNNYNLLQPTGLAANITVRDVTIRAVTDTREYNGLLTSAGLPTVDAATGTTGLVGGETLTGTQVFDNKNASAVNGRTLTVNTTTGGNGFLGGNYNVITQTALGTITRKAITATGITANSRIYDATTNATFTGTPTVSTGVGGETFDVTAGTVAFGQTNVGNGLAVTATGFGLTNAGGGADVNNYSFNQPTGLVANITPRTLRIGAVSDTKTYDGLVTSAGTPTVGAAANEGLAGLDALNALLQKFDSKNASAPNGRTMTVDPVSFAAGSASNYNIVLSTATGTINQRVVTIGGLTAQDKIYDANTTATVTGGTINNAVGGDTLSFVQGANNFASSNVGTNQVVTLTGYTLSGADAGNYALNVQPGPLNASITPRALTAALINSTTKVYDGNTAATLTSANYQLTGFVAGQGATVTEAVGVYDNRNVGTGKGVTAALAGNDFVAGAGTLLSNYTLPTTAAGNIGIITPKALTLSGLMAQDKVYDANTAATLTGGTLTGTITGDVVSVTSGTGTFNTANVGTGKPVTVTGITFGGADAGNYTFTTPTGLVAAVTPAALTVAGPTTTKVYGAADPALTPTAAGFKGNDTAATVLSGALTRATGSNVGNYAVTQGTLVSNPNYVITYTPGLFGITPAPLTVIAEAKTKVYGTTDPALTFTAAGFVNGDTASILTGALNRAAGENVGSYGIAQGGVTAGANYTITYTAANLAITPATLTVLPNPTTKIYGDTDPTLGFTLTGLANGDTPSVVTGALGRNPGENVGGYAFVPGTLTGGGNYVLVLSPNAPLFSITPAVLQIAANPSSKIFGNADPALTFTIAGLKNGDTPSIVTGAQTRAPGENAGIYAIQRGTVAATPNYTVVYTPNNLTIGRASLNISIPNATRLAGQPNPLFPSAVTGLAGGDTVASLFGASGVPVTTTATTESPAGQFPLTASVALANYNVTVVPGTLTVTAAAPPVMVAPEPVQVPGLGSSLAALAGGIGSAAGTSNFGVVGSSSFAPPTASGLAITIKESASTSDSTTVNQATVQIAGNSADVGGTRAAGDSSGGSSGYIDQEVGGGRFTVVVDTTKVEEQQAFDVRSQGTVQVENDVLADNSILRDSSFDAPLPVDEAEEERLARILRERQAQGSNGGNASNSSTNSAAVALRR